ncbi:hypothetical protein JTE90_009086 [Oedothorax gibbosus]|uniref:RRP15-like protein n=1 Tax=Oedothorax gibbosus TaxID=931172 RepID=A0AAV6V1P9_9ARAC|nr:hypothetical protein JTE90_009086 [Oedothorax gibbosus]
MYDSEESNKESEAESEVESHSVEGAEENEKDSSFRKKKRARYDDDVSMSEEEEAGNMAWADALSKVLHSSDRILSKAKKDADIKPKAAPEIEVVDESGQVVSEDKTKEPKSKTQTLLKSKKEMLDRMNKKSEWELMGRVKPDIRNKEKERELVKIATRGVVYLFNTVEKHQKSKKDPKSNPKKDKKLGAIKGNFMDILKDYAKKDKVELDPVVKKTKEEETWSILKDDFMMGAGMKDWDKESDVET